MTHTLGAGPDADRTIRDPADWTMAWDPVNDNCGIAAGSSALIPKFASLGDIL
jgi:hypothetical protein